MVSALCVFFALAATPPKKPVVLVFSKTNGFRHSSIPVGIAAIKKLGDENGFAVETSEDSLVFNSNRLKKYKAIVFLSTTGKIFGPAQERALQQFIHNGGGYMGIHAATDCEYNWPWYNQLAGAWFLGHPEQQQATLLVVNKNHPSTAGFPDTWVRKDEWYNFKNLNTTVTVLIKIDESSYKGGQNGTNHPMAWFHTFEGGRAFYTELGHTDESYADSLYLKHILGGIEYALGRKK